MREHLYGFAQAHVVGQYAAQTCIGKEVEPGQAIELIGPQFGTKSLGRGHGRGGAAQVFQLCTQAFATVPRQAGILADAAQGFGLGAVQAQAVFAGHQPFQQWFQHRAQAHHRQAYAAVVVDAHAPRGILRLAIGFAHREIRVGQDATQDRQQVDALSIDVDAERDVEPGAAGFVDFRVPVVDLHHVIAREIGFVFDAEAGCCQFAQHQGPGFGRERRLACVRTQQVLVRGEGFGAQVHVVAPHHGIDEVEGFEPGFEAFLLCRVAFDFQYFLAPRHAFAHIAAEGREQVAFVVQQQCCHAQAQWRTLRIAAPGVDFRHAHAQYRYGRGAQVAQRAWPGHRHRHAGDAFEALLYIRYIFRLQLRRALDQLQQARIALHATVAQGLRLHVPEAMALQQARGFLVVGLHAGAEHLRAIGLILPVQPHRPFRPWLQWRAAALPIDRMVRQQTQQGSFGMGRGHGDGVIFVRMRRGTGQQCAERDRIVRAPATRRRGCGPFGMQFQRAWIDPSAAASAPRAQEARHHREHAIHVAQDQAEATFAVVQSRVIGRRLGQMRKPLVPRRQGACAGAGHLAGHGRAQPAGQCVQLFGRRRLCRCGGLGRAIFRPVSWRIHLGIQQHQGLMLARAAHRAVARTHQRKTIALWAKLDPRFVDGLGAATHQCAQAPDAAPVQLETQALQVVFLQVRVGAPQRGRIELAAPVDPGQIVAYLIRIHACVPDFRKPNARLCCIVQIRATPNASGNRYGSSLVFPPRLAVSPRSPTMDGV